MSEKRSSEKRDTWPITWPHCGSGSGAQPECESVGRFGHATSNEIRRHRKITEKKTRNVLYYAKGHLKNT